MSWLRAGAWAMAAAMVYGRGALGAQVATTTISDTVYHADGTVASGLVIVNWPSFTTGAGQSVPGGSTSATIGGNGVLTLALAPNMGATPAGTYYTAVFHLDDGTTSRQSWSIPVSTTPVTLAAVQASVLPASVAVQTATKSYVDDAVAAALAGQPVAGAITFLNRTGDTMVGPLVLAGDPTTGNQAATKHYVDASVASVGSGLTAKIGISPTVNQVIAQPAGTQMEVNRINSESFASQFVTGLGNNGLGNTLATQDCAGGCQITMEQGFRTGEALTATQWGSTATDGTHVRDLRGGGVHDMYFNPVNQTSTGYDAGQVIDVTSTKPAQTVLQTWQSSFPTSAGLAIYHHGLAGGTNLYPYSIEQNRSPYFKSTFDALSVEGTYNTLGQHVLSPNRIACYGVGDCLIGAQFVTASGGFRDEADEGTHPMDLQIMEDSQVFDGTCASGCTTGATSLQVAVTQGAGTQGDGRFLLDMNPTRMITAGTLIGGGNTGADLVGPTANFSGSNFPVSVFLRTAASATSQAQNVAPGTVTLPLVTTGLPAGFAASTGSLPQTSGVACVTDVVNGFNPHNYEMANYSVVDGTHLQLTLNKVHAANATVAVGGLCGYGLEQTVDTVAGIRQVFPVIGSLNATTLYYAGGLTPIVGQMGSTSAFVNVSLPIATMTRTGGTVTVTTAAALPKDVNGLTMTVTGAADASYNGSFAVTSTGATTMSFANAGANGSTSGGTISVVTGGFALYPMAEVLSVYNGTTKAVDGQMTLAPNNVAWASGDALEEPHYFQESVTGDVEFVGQQTPRPTTLIRAGMQYQTNVGPGLRGWSVMNRVPATSYLGNGGTHSAPDEALDVEGIWNYTMEAQAGETGVFRLHCNSHGCGRWNSGYHLFDFDGTAGPDFLSFSPQSDTMQVTMGGSSVSFTPAGLQAGVVRATTLSGALDAGNVTSGTLAPARLPLFGASGAAHGAGAVPDPGASAGSTRFLREDGIWATPAGGGGGTGASSGGASGTASLNGGTIQNAAISGGSLDAAPIGQQTPAAAQFTSLGVSGCNWFLSGTDQGVGTCAPTSWSAVAGVAGSNLQIHSAGAARLIVVSDGGQGAMAEFHFVNTAAPTGSRNWRFSNNTNGQLRMDVNADDYSTSTVALLCQPNGSCAFPHGVTASNFNGILSGATGTIGGAALQAGTCASGVASVPGATVGVPVAVSAADGSLPNGLTMLSAAVTSGGTVTVQVCAVAATTPAAEVYNVRVLQ